MKDHIQQLFLPLCLFIAMVFTCSAVAEVYMIVDDQGNVTYTDQRPSADAEPMDLPGLSVIAPQKPATPPPAATLTESEPEVTSIRDLRRGYRDFAISHPTEGQTFSGTGNEISGIAWTTRYGLQAGMRVTVYLNGEAQPPTNATVVNVGRLDRGEHVVFAVLTDSKNRRIATTDPVTFYMQQNSVIFNARRRAAGG